MATKFYAVKKGKKTGIFRTWTACKEQVGGFSGAVYKSFATLAEAETYLRGESGAVSVAESAVPKVEAVAYVDGSYNHQTREFSYGAVIFYKGQTYQFAEKYADPELQEMRNVAGELKGAECAMQFCLDNQIKTLAIYHDYEGIARWCTGEWQAKKKGTQAYRRFYQSVRQSVQVTFVKVKGHSGDKYNELVDQLAKSVLGI